MPGGGFQGWENLTAQKEQIMPKIRMKTLAIGPNVKREVGKVYNVSPKEAKDLIDGGFAEAANDAPTAPEAAATEGAPETATLPAAQTKPGK
jgi:hypothetical protein